MKCIYGEVDEVLVWLGENFLEDATFLNQMRPLFTASSVPGRLIPPIGDARRGDVSDYVRPLLHYVDF